MVKTVLSVSHQGLRDWVIQRVSAIVLALYTIGMSVYLFSHPGLSFAEWHGLFSQIWLKIVTILFILALLYHAWIGMWTVFTDYLKPFVLRCIANLLVLFMLAACFIWALLILWSV